MIDFETAPAKLAELVSSHLGNEMCQSGRIVRDVYGLLTFVTAKKIEKSQSDALQTEIDVFLDGHISRDCRAAITIDKGLLEDLKREPFIVISAGAHKAYLIDRRLAGDDWMTRPRALVSPQNRLIFYSIKGGVGRSTALAITAADLAARGKNVLVIDFDLEAPALGSLLLDESSLPLYGVVDWYAAVACGRDASGMLSDIVGSSPFTASSGIVHVVPCLGSTGGSYISKLSRAYTPGSAGTPLTHASFSEKANSLINGLCELRTYDAILIDARAGLHETSGALLLGLGARALLFGIDTTQTLDGYDLLFAALANVFAPELQNEDLRGAFKMVHAKAPQDPSQREQFLSESWKLWSESLYDEEEEADLAEQASFNSFVFDLYDENAPHFPISIMSSESFVRFDPRRRAFMLENINYENVFGNFLKNVRTILGIQ